MDHIFRWIIETYLVVCEDLVPWVGRTRREGVTQKSTRKSYDRCKIFEV